MKISNVVMSFKVHAIYPVTNQRLFLDLHNGPLHVSALRMLDIFSKHCYSLFFSETSLYWISSISRKYFFSNKQLLV